MRFSGLCDERLGRAKLRELCVVDAGEIKIFC